MEIRKQNWCGAPQLDAQDLQDIKPEKKTRPKRVKEGEKPKRKPRLRKGKSSAPAGPTPTTVEEELHTPQALTQTEALSENTHSVPSAKKQKVKEVYYGVEF